MCTNHRYIIPVQNKQHNNHLCIVTAKSGSPHIMLCMSLVKQDVCRPSLANLSVAQLVL